MAYSKNYEEYYGFLGLKRYYCKFVKKYGGIKKTLASLLKKDSFSWTPKATQTFEKLMEAMCRTLVLVMLDFTKTFIVECYALGNGNW
jgi:hypothetical protein